MTDTVTTAALRARVEGRARTGTVSIRNFDQGVVETLGAKVIGDTYFITELSKYDAPPGCPGIPVVFSHAEDVFQTFRIPVIEVRRDDISPALNRWHPGTLQYHVPAMGSRPVTNEDPIKFSANEEMQQAVPFDFMYSIKIMAASRQYMTAANLVLDYVLRIYQPYCRVLLTDSIGDGRSYEAFMDACSPMDEVSDVANRGIGFVLSLRVEGELDLNDTLMFPTVTQPPTVNMGRR